MDRWRLWRRVWFRVNRKKHGRRQYAVATRTRSAPVTRDAAPPGRYMLERRHYSFMSTLAAGISQRPKVLMDVDCSNLLTGGSGQYENFSSTCWLEDHLHRFGEPACLPSQHLSPNSSHFNLHHSEHVETSTSALREMVDDLDDFHLDSDEGDDDDDDSESGSTGVGDNGGYGGVGIGGVVIDGNVRTRNLRRHPVIQRSMAIMDPPPYVSEPPPSYEEAVAGNSFLNAENTDFLW